MAAILLSVVGIFVQIEVLLVRKPLKLDIFLLRREGRQWTKEQRERLPDGIRQRSERHILCEFKYTESVNHDALVQALNYEMLPFFSFTINSNAKRPSPDDRRLNNGDLAGQKGCI